MRLGKGEQVEAGEFAEYEGFLGMRIHNNGEVHAGEFVEVTIQVAVVTVLENGHDVFINFNAPCFVSSGNFHDGFSVNNTNAVLTGSTHVNGESFGILHFDPLPSLGIWVNDAFELNYNGTNLQDAYSELLPSFAGRAANKNVSQLGVNT